MIYKTPKHAAKMFAKQYLLSLGGGWFQTRYTKMQGLEQVASYMTRHRFMTVLEDGRALVDKADLAVRNGDMARFVAESA